MDEQQVSKRFDFAIKSLESVVGKDVARSVETSMENATDKEKLDLANKVFLNVLQPDQTTSNNVWLIVVWTFAMVMGCAVLVLGLSVFMAPVASGTKPEIILTIFTTTAAFLAGLFAPSPVQSRS
jgi:hypothetical protein